MQIPVYSLTVLVVFIFSVKFDFWVKMQFDTPNPSFYRKIDSNLFIIFPIL
jgi:hypothetical protein